MKLKLLSYKEKTKLTIPRGLNDVSDYVRRKVEMYIKGSIFFLFFFFQSIRFIALLHHLFCFMYLSTQHNASQYQQKGGRPFLPL